MFSNINLTALKTMKCVDIEKKGHYKRGESGIRKRVIEAQYFNFQGMNSAPSICIKGK